MGGTLHGDPQHVPQCSRWLPSSGSHMVQEAGAMFHTGWSQKGKPGCACRTPINLAA